MKNFKKIKKESLKNLTPELQFMVNRISLYNSIIKNHSKSKFKDKVINHINFLYLAFQNAQEK